jgi:hypothetical protein
VKGSHVSAFAVVTGAADGASAAPSIDRRHGPIAPTSRKPEAAPGPPFSAKVIGRCAASPASARSKAT